MKADVSGSGSGLPNLLHSRVSTGSVKKLADEYAEYASPPWASPAPRGADPANINSSDFELTIESDAVEHVSSKRQWLSHFTQAPRELRERSQFEVEQALASPGSLPRPLTLEQREEAARNLQPTATHAMLSKVPRNLLEQATPEVQHLRRTLTKGATVVFVCAGLKSKKFIYERAAELGVRSIIVDHHDSWSQEMVNEGIISQFVSVDMSQSSEEVYKQTLQMIQQVGGVDAITTFIELSVPLVSRLCEAMGLPGMTPAAVDAARDKHATRAVLKKAGLPTPKNMLISSATEVVQAGQHVGFPAVLKPVSGAASLGVKKVTSMEELKACYDEIAAELGSLVVSSGALVKGDNSENGVAANAMVDLTLLLEQYLDGPEFDIDVVVSDGKWQFAAVSDNGPTLEPYFNETWAVSPSLQPKQEQAAVKDLAVKSVEALGFDSGVFHVECKFTSNGPQLIEVNARMGGGQVRECNLRTWGVDLVEEQLFLSLGIPSRPAVPRLPLEPVAYCYINAQSSGKVVDLSCMKELQGQDGIIWARPMVKPGSVVVGPADGMPTWICDVCLTKETPKEALDFLLELQNSLAIKIQK